MTESGASGPKRSLFRLLGDLPGLLVEQLRNELDLLKQELAAKAKNAGVGIGLLAAAGSVAFFLLGVLITAGILGLATVMPAWAAALVVAAILLVITGILAAVGVQQLKKSTPPTPTRTITSIKRDVDTITGTGKRD